MANSYDIHQTVMVTGTFSDDAGLADPSTVTLKIQDPSGNETTYTYALGEVTRESIGVYSKAINVDEQGRWYYRWEGATAGITAVLEDWFYVLPSEF